MSRPRKASDAEVFAAAQRVMSRRGPGEITLAHIAAEAGVTAGALVQRFGSKRSLLLSMAQEWSRSAGAFFAALQARHASPLAALRDFAACLADLAASPAAYARNLAYLQIDLADPDFRRHLVVYARAMRTWLDGIVQHAIRVRELRAATDAPALARTVEVVLNGSLMTWAFHREGKAVDRLRQDLEAVLAPYLTARGQPHRERAR